MKGKNLVKTPGELYAPTQNGVVVSADGVWDYNQGKTQEVINDDVIRKVNATFDAVEYVKETNDLTANIITLLEAHGSEDLAGVLSLDSRVGVAENDISDLQNQLQDQLNGYRFEVLTEEAYNALDEKDQNTLYFIEEED